MGAAELVQDEWQRPACEHRAGCHAAHQASCQLGSAYSVNREISKTVIFDNLAVAKISALHCPPGQLPAQHG